MKPRKKLFSPARRRFLKIGAGTALAGLSAAAYGHEWEPDHPRVTRRIIHLPGWPASAAGLTVGHLSDLHCQDRRAEARTASAARRLLAEAPDIVFLTGDYISGGFAASWIGAAAGALSPLRAAPRGVFAVLGNHDYADGHSGDLAAALEGSGFHVLRNRAVPFPGVDGAWIVGLESALMAFQNPVQALAGVPENAVKLLLVHEPDYADDAPRGISLQLSGHSHAGQVRVPGLPPLHCPQLGARYPEGLQQAQNHLVYTTRGVGMMGPQVRFCCPPEITILRIFPA